MIDLETEMRRRYCLLWFCHFTYLIIIYGVRVDVLEYVDLIIWIWTCFDVISAEF